MVKAKSKSKTPRLLSYGETVPALVAIAIVGLLSAQILTFLILIVNFGMISSINRYVKGMTFVQLEDGSTRPAKSLGPNERTDKTIKTFVSGSMIKIFNWKGLIEAKENGEIITIPDKGVEIQTDKGGRKRIPTETWSAAFALSDHQDFRASFLKKLALMVPEGIFNGNAQVSLIPRHMSEPRKISDGKWEVDFIATLVTFDRDKNQGGGVTFNKTITVEAIDTPQSPPKTTELAEKIYSARESGLEITQIVDLDLGKNKK